MVGIKDHCIQVCSQKQRSIVCVWLYNDRKWLEKVSGNDIQIFCSITFVRDKDTSLTWELKIESGHICFVMTVLF